MKSPNLEHENALHKQGYKYILGIDEAGRGPLAGDVYAAAVILPLDFEPKGITDSKKLTEKKREELFDYIITNCAAYGIGTATVQEIDSINIRNAAFLAMKRAIEACIARADNSATRDIEGSNPSTVGDAVLGVPRSSLLIANRHQNRSRFRYSASCSLRRCPISQSGSGVALAGRRFFVCRIMAAAMAAWLPTGKRVPRLGEFTMSRIPLASAAKTGMPRQTDSMTLLLRPSRSDGRIVAREDSINSGTSALSPRKCTRGATPNFDARRFIESSRGPEPTNAR